MKAIVTYHSVDTTSSVISIEPAAFRAHIEHIARHGPPVVPVEQLRTMPRDVAAAAITFDDAFANFATDAWPVLRAHQLPVTLFVPTDFVGKTNRWSANDAAIPQLPLLSWDELARLAEEGVSIGSHTCSHPHLDRVGAEQRQAELARSAEQIERNLGVRARGLAYPYGSYDAPTVCAAASLYEFACTTELRVLRDDDDAHRLPRLDAYYLRQPDGLAGWGSPRLRLYLRARAGARRCRELLSSAVSR